MNITRMWVQDWGQRGGGGGISIVFMVRKTHIHKVTDY